MSLPRTIFELGKDAQFAGMPITDCPYDKAQVRDAWLEWRRGHMSGALAEQASKVHYEEAIIFAPKDENPDDTVMGAKGPGIDQNGDMIQPKDLQPKDRPRFLPPDRPWSKDAEKHNEEPEGWERDGEAWKDPKPPKDDQ